MLLRNALPVTGRILCHGLNRSSKTKEQDSEHRWDWPIRPENCHVILGAPMRLRFKNNMLKKYRIHNFAVMPFQSKQSTRAVLILYNSNNIAVLLGKRTKYATATGAPTFVADPIHKPILKHRPPLVCDVMSGYFLSKARIFSHRLARCFWSLRRAPGA
jgi:hypothetical protein